MSREPAAAKKRVQLLKNLPTLPGMMEQISRAVESQRFSAEDIGKLISRDQVLTAKVLKLANSAFFGFSRKVGSLTQALVLLGFDVIKGLLLTSSVFDLMKTRSAGLWQHSMGVAATSAIIARELGLGEMEEISLAGLLHDLGKVVIRVHMPAETQAIQKLVEEEGLSVREAEARVLGFTHAQVGQWLAESWKLPDNLAEPIRWHHKPAAAPSQPKAVAAVHLADVLVRGYGLGDGGDVWVPPLDRFAVRQLKLSGKQLEAVVDAMCAKITAQAPPQAPA